jgi:hypothetical protein
MQGDPVACGVVGRGVDVVRHLVPRRRTLHIGEGLADTAAMKLRNVSTDPPVNPRNRMPPCVAKARGSGGGAPSPTPPRRSPRSPAYHKGKQRPQNQPCIRQREDVGLHVDPSSLDCCPRRLLQIPPHAFANVT